MTFHDPNFNFTTYQVFHDPYEHRNKILKFNLIYDCYDNTSTGSQRSNGGAYSNISWQLSITLLWDNDAA